MVVICNLLGKMVGALIAAYKPINKSPRDNKKFQEVSRIDRSYLALDLQYPLSRHRLNKIGNKQKLQSGTEPGGESGSKGFGPQHML